jgi:hypothetical protein
MSAEICFGITESSIEICLDIPKVAQKGRMLLQSRVLRPHIGSQEAAISAKRVIYSINNSK